jgi:hypothetical protein
MRSKDQWTVKQSDDVKAKGTIRVLKLRRETLRELNAGELKQAQGGVGPPLTKKCTKWCDSYTHCTLGCG